MHEEQIAYHRSRAAREQDLSLSCESSAAARCHRRLSTLHLARVRELQAEPAQPVPVLAA